MITYQDIENANSTLHFSDIKGKNYAEVPQRVKAFRMLYPQGFIITDMVSNDGGVCVFKATAGYYGENGEAYTLGTGTAYEKEGSSYINKTSYIENCETSAVGRALGFLNIGSDSSIASYEEVMNAKKQQEQAENAAATYIPEDAPGKIEQVQHAQFAPAFNATDAIKNYCAEMEISIDKFGEYYDALVKAKLVPRIKAAEMTKNQCMALLNAVTLNCLQGKTA